MQFITVFSLLVYMPKLELDGAGFYLQHFIASPIIPVGENNGGGRQGPVEEKRCSVYTQEFY